MVDDTERPLRNVSSESLTDEQRTELQTQALDSTKASTSPDSMSTVVPIRSDDPSPAIDSLATSTSTPVDKLSTLAQDSSLPSTSSLGVANGSRSLGPAVAGASRYQVIRFHAKGGLGYVSLARDQELNREVALKEIQPQYADDLNSRAKFILEAEVTGALEHPGIVPIYGLGCYSDGKPYYAMRFIRGTSFADSIDHFHADSKSGELSAAQRTIQLRSLLQRFIAVCQAIHYAHSRGVVHRDIKPGNVMLGDYGETLVVDWGLAKTVTQEIEPDESEGVIDSTGRRLEPISAGNVTPTRMGSAVGTLQFMSPEQSEGRNDQMGPSADIYSLGATLYYLLTGHPWVTGQTIGELMETIRRGQVPPPHQLRREVPKSLSAICLKAMARRPDDRYPSAVALAEDVERWLADEPVLAHQDSVAERAARWLRHNRTWFRAVMIATLLIIGILIVSVFLIDGQRQIAEDARGRAVKLAIERTELANRESKLRKQAEWDAANRSFEQSLLLCERVDATTGVLSLIENLEEAEQIEATDLVTSIRSQIGQWQGAVHTLEKIIPLDSSIRWLQPTPDRKRMLVGTNTKAILVDAASGEAMGQPLPLESRVIAAVVHPNDNTFATVSEDSQIRFWNLDSLEQVGDALLVNGEVTTMELSADASRWAVVTGQSIEFWDWQKRAATEQTLAHAALITDLKFLEGGNRMLSTDWDGNVFHWDLNTSPATHETWKLDSSVFRIAIAADEKHAATCEVSNKVRLWEIETGRMTGLPMVHYGLIGHVSFDSTGQRLITGCLDQNARIWDVATSTLIGSPLRHPLIVNSALIAEDGLTVWTGCGDRGLRQWRLANGRSQSLPLGPNGNVISSDFSHQGNTIEMLAGTLEAGKIVIPGARMTWARNQSLGQWLPHEHVANDAWHSVAAFSNTGQVIAAGTRSSGVQIWDKDSNQPLSPEIALSSEPKFLVFSPDDQRLLIGTADGEVTIVDVPSGEPSCEPIQLGSRVSSASFFPDAKRVLVGSWDEMVRVFDWTSTGLKKTGELKLDMFTLAVGVDHAGQRFFTSSASGDIRIWDASTLQPIGKVMHHDARAHQVVWSHDHQRLISGHTDGSIRVWDTRTGGLIGPPWWHKKEVMSLSLNADDHHIATASADWSARLWNVASETGSVDAIRSRLQRATGVTRSSSGSLQSLSIEKWQQSNLAASTH